jgi:hypothetical protein
VEHDGGDAATRCTGFPPVLCDFDSVCPPLAFIGGFGTGQPESAADAGLDGSTAFRALVPDGGAALFAMPFRELAPGAPSPLRTIPPCGVTCEANARIAQGASGPFTIVMANEDGFRLEVEDGRLVHKTSIGPTIATTGAIVSSDWIHITVRLTPADGGATSEVTLLTRDASTTTLGPITEIGAEMVFGAQVASPTGPVEVFVDDITCRLSD